MPADAFDLTGQVAVVTGGGTGIGRATARVLADHGADVVVASRRVENLERTAAEVKKRHRRALVVQTDVRKPEECARLIDTTINDFGRLDILVNNAGGSKAFPLDQWTLAEWQNSIALNLESVFFLSQRAARHMIEGGAGGSIVNISSGASQLGLPHVAPYGAAKAGVNNLTRSMAAEYGRHGIRVNCIAVGAVKSEGFIRSMEAIGRDPDAVGASTNSIGRAGEPEEIAYPILFLVSAAASFLSGETIHVGGGPPLQGPW
ncbi:MAG TPA: SDR family oxidoreductase [Acidimicrobiales bacterium]|nr:SDR family oxidoreductase [Acidimicrobiales bacterium]